MPDPDFDPRTAALRHAAMVQTKDIRNHGTAIASALIYVGDQIGATNDYLSAVVNLLEQLDVSVNNGLVAIAED